MSDICNDNDCTGEVSARIHVLIGKGIIPLPTAEIHEIYKKKRELEAILRLLVRTYVALVCARRLEDAAEVLSAYRGLGEADLSPVFEQWGYPDESKDHEEARLWRALACAVSGKDETAHKKNHASFDGALVAEWREILQEYAECSR